LIEIELIEKFIALESGIAWPILPNKQAIAVENPAKITPWATIQHTDLPTLINSSRYELGLSSLQGNGALPVAVVALNLNSFCITGLDVGRASGVIHQQAGAT